MRNFCRKSSEEASRDPHQINIKSTGLKTSHRLNDESWESEFPLLILITGSPSQFFFHNRSHGRDSIPLPVLRSSLPSSILPQETRTGNNHHPNSLSLSLPLSSSLSLSLSPSLSPSLRLYLAHTHTPPCIDANILL